ncbi:hypothetical protein [Streptomyces sp. NPDC018693]
MSDAPVARHAEPAEPAFPHAEHDRRGARAEEKVRYFLEVGR